MSIRIKGSLVIVAIAAVATIAIAAVRLHEPTADVASSSVVRVVLPSQIGTGFFVTGPDQFAYVITAQHVVDTGEPILVEHTVDVPGGAPYVEAYPEVAVVAFDAALDLAVLRLKNVRADRVTPLALAASPRKDESILSYGFPASSLAKSSGIMSKPGKILSLVKFPAYDRGTGTVVREDAADGLLISAEIEPGFSGGPTCNDRGEVVGVNVTKDLVHRGQNGAVSVVAVRELLSRVKPAAPAGDVTAADVKALLGRIESELLLLPIERRVYAPTQDYVSARDLPRLDQLVEEVRKLDGDTARDPRTKLSGQAVLGIALMRLPGRPLETFLARSTRKALEACDLRQRGLETFFGKLGPGEDGGDPGATPARCAAFALRPMLWDLTALALQWEGKVRDITVTKVESVDADAHEYRAAVRFADVEHLVDVWLSTDGGRLRLKLFDKAGVPAGIAASRSVAASAFVGTWHRTEPRTSHESGAAGGEAEVATDELLVLSLATDGAVSATHELRRSLYRTGARLPCGSGASLELGLEQSFSGTLDNGSIVAFRQSPAKALGADMGACGRALTYQPDQVAVFKLVDDKLMMYRTDGVAFPETAEFHR